MVTYKLVPTSEIVRRAEENGENIFDYWNTRATVTRTEDADRQRKGDLRRREKNNQFIDDVAITFDDGTKIQIHPTSESEVEEFDKVELYVYLPNQKGVKLITYTDKDGLDYAKMQTNPNYLETLGKLLSPTRLNEKMNKARQNGLDQACYIGGVGLKDGRFRKTANYVKNETIAINKIKEAIEKLKYMERLEKANKENERYKKELIAEIESGLPYLSINELNAIREQIRINELSRKSFGITH